MPFIPELPGVMAEMLHGMEYEVVTMGDTKDDVICFKKGNDVCFLKTGKLNTKAQIKNPKTKGGMPTEHPK